MILEIHRIIKNPIIIKNPQLELWANQIYFRVQEMWIIFIKLVVRGILDQCTVIQDDEKFGKNN